MALARTALVLTLLLPIACAPVQPASVSELAMPLPRPGDPLVRPEMYTLVWNDDFTEGNRPDPGRWRYETMRNGKGWFNGEQQYYAHDRTENARVENDRLVIEARAESLADSDYRDWSGQHFTSARLTTRGNAAWRFGFFQIRAKMPRVRGAWPAIWLLPEHHDMRWQGGEIDIAETVGYGPETVHHSVQSTERNFTKGNQSQNASKVSYCGAFHDYQLLWTADSVVIGVDGQVGFATSDVVAFDRKMSLILNVAVGGEWAGAKGIDPDGFPARMEVESVAIWQRGKAP